MGYDNHLRLDPLQTEKISKLWGSQFPITEEQARDILNGDFVAQPEEKEEDMSFTNQAARELAEELLADQSKRGLRETVETAIENLKALIADTDCGSTLTFMKTKDDGKQHYFYACVKNGGKWYTTAQNPRVLEDDNALIAWLIGLEIYEAPMLEVTPPAHRHELANPIETTAEG